MGRDNDQATLDLFSADTVRDAYAASTKPSATEAAADKPAQWHVLPKNLRHAVKQLSDGELDELFLRWRSMRQSGEADCHGLLQQTRRHRLRVLRSRCGDGRPEIRPVINEK